MNKYEQKERPVDGVQYNEYGRAVSITVLGATYYNMGNVNRRSSDGSIDHSARFRTRDGMILDSTIQGEMLKKYPRQKG